MKEVEIDYLQEQKIAAEKIEDKTYFKDALNWYFVKYLSPISERSILIGLCLISLFSGLIIYLIINAMFPLVENVPVILQERDSSKYAPIVRELNAKKDRLDNINEAVARHLVNEYVRERESFDYSEGNIEAYNKKLLIMQNNSSASILKDFKEINDINSKSSPLKYFGRNVTRDIEIIGFEYVRKKDGGLLNKIKNSFLFKKASNEAIVTMKLVTKTLGKTIVKVQRVRVSFYFNGIEKKDGEFSSVKFFITEYKYL